MTPSPFQLRVDDQVLQAFEGYKCLIAYASGIDNTAGREYAQGVLKEACGLVRDSFPFSPVSEHPHIMRWRACYAQFGSKPSKYLCSVEALLKRVIKGDDIPSVNPIVDLYNAVSLDSVIPIGGEDWNKLASDLHLKFSDGTEPFVALQNGEVVTENPTPGEVVWADGEGVTCRRWNWRQCSRTAVTDRTTAAYFVFDVMPPFDLPDAEWAQKRLEEHVSRIQAGVHWTTERVSRKP